MGAITPTITKLTEFSGDYKVLLLTAELASASDTVTLTRATHGIGTIQAVFAQCQSGLDAQLVNISASFSGLVITIASIEQDGTDSTAWGQTVTILVIGS